MEEIREKFNRLAENREKHVEARVRNTVEASIAGPAADAIIDSFLYGHHRGIRWAFEVLRPLMQTLLECDPQIHERIVLEAMRRRALNEFDLRIQKMEAQS